MQNRKKKKKRRNRFIEQSFRLCGRRRGWDVSREQHQNMYYYQVWNRSPARVGCMRQVLRPGALGRPRGIGSRGRWEGGLGWGIHVNPWLIHVNVWQKPLQYYKVISLQLIKINGKKNKKKSMASSPITSRETDGETVETVSHFIFLGSKNHCRWWLQPWN